MNVFLELFAKYLNNVRSLHVYYIDRSNLVKQCYLSKEFIAARKKSVKLEELLLNERIHLKVSLDEAELLRKSLKSFNFCININETENNLHDLFRAKISEYLFFGLNLSLTKERNLFETNKSTGLNKIDSFLEENYSSSLNEKFTSIRFDHLKSLNSVIEDWSFSSIQKCKFITTIDLRIVHLHSSQSICKAIAGLTSKKPIHFNYLTI
jgi:hypothetical protein